MKQEKPRNIKSLLKSYDSKTLKKKKKLKFVGVEGRDVYNVTAPFKFKRTFYLLGRVEAREEETNTKVMFFRRPQHSHAWHLDNKCPVFDLQDPFVAKLKDTFIVGGVEVIQRSTRKHLSYRTVFYKGKDIHNLRRFAHSPWGMKGIRLMQLPDKRIFVFTRHHGKVGRRGKIGVLVLESLNQLTLRNLSKACIIRGQFARGEWGGVNEIHLLSDGRIGALGHIAKYSKDRKRHYFPIAFSLDFEMWAFSHIKILAKRSDLPDGEAKRSDIQDVIYPGGIVRNGKGKARLYVGVGDAEAYELTIEDPFLEYEFANVDD